MTDVAVLAPWLWLCTVLLAGRIAGQLVVFWCAPGWLPPMESWQSGLVRYRTLVAGQALTLTLMVWISIDFSRARGVWTTPNAAFGWVVLVWSYLYAAAMVIRYVRRMISRPDQRWLGGTIPIVFHTVIAVFQWMLGMYHVAAR